MSVELVKRHETKLLVVCMVLLAAAAGWLLLTRPAYRIEGDFLYHEDQSNVSDGWIAGQMRSSVAETRARACLALGRIGDPATIELLLQALSDPVPRIRAAAAFAIGLIEDRWALAHRGLEVDPRAAQALTAALDDDERLVVTRAVEALGKMVWQGAFPRVTQTPAPLPITMAALVRLGNRDAIPWIRSRLRSDDQDTRWAATFALHELGADLDGDLTSSLLNLTKDINLWVRIAAVRALSRTQPSPEVLERLTAMTLDRDPKVRIEALRSLGRLGQAGALAVLVTSLGDANVNVRQAAVGAMGSLGNREAMPLLQSLRFQPSPVAYQAELALAALAESEAEFFAGLDEIPPAYRNPAGLERFVLALGRFRSPKSLDWLTALWKTNEPDLDLLRPVILRALATQEAADLPRYLADAMSDASPQVRLAALELMDEPSLGACRRVYEEALDSQGTAALRLAALDAAARAEDNAAKRNLLAAALDDPDRAVRIRAVKHLRLLFGEDHGEKIGLAEPRYAREEYQRIARTTGWQVVMETSAGLLEISLDYENAALTAEYFLELVRRAGSASVRFVDVAPGDWLEVGLSSAETSMLGSAIAAGINSQPFLRGSLGMARAGHGGRDLSFVICLSPQPLWDGRYVNFGRLISGDAVLDQITRETRILRLATP